MRPLLPSDLVPASLSKSSSASGSEFSTPEPFPDDEERAKEMVRAAIEYPDKLDHREIVVNSSSESAMGQERKDQWSFAFDKVSSHIFIFYVANDRI